MRTERNKIKKIRFLIKVRSLLRSKRTKELFTFLFFVLIASFFWFLQLIKEDVETDFRIPVRITNLPKDMVLNSDLPRFLNVRVKDKGATIFSYYFSRPLPVFEIDFNHLKNGESTTYLGAEIIVDRLRKKFAPGTEIVSIFPDNIPLSFVHGESALVDVSLLSAITTSVSCGLSGNIEYYPQRIEVFAASSQIGQLRKIYTPVLRLRNLSDTTLVTIDLPQRKGIRFVPSQIKVRIPVETLTEKSMDIPIQGINLPDGLTMRIFPLKVRLVCAVALSKYNQVKPSDFQIVIDYADFAKAGNARYKIRLLKSPPFISRVRLQPAEAEVLIEESLQ